MKWLELFWDDVKEVFKDEMGSSFQKETAERLLQSGAAELVTHEYILWKAWVLYRIESEITNIVVAYMHIWGTPTNLQETLNILQTTALLFEDDTTTWCELWQRTLEGVSFDSLGLVSLIPEYGLPERLDKENHMK